MINKLTLLFFIFCINTTYIFSQTNSAFLGEFSIKEMCTDKNNPNCCDTSYYIIDISETNEVDFDIQFDLNIFFKQNIKAVILNEKDFQIPTQELKDFDNNSIYVTGDGAVQSDSISFDYRIGGAIGLFNCSCIGKKIVESKINMFNEESNSILFPNPIYDKLNITLPESYYNQNLMVYIYDPEGKLIQKENVFCTGSMVIDVSDLIAGTYFLNVVNSKNIVYSGSFIKR